MAAAICVLRHQQFRLMLNPLAGQGRNYCGWHSWIIGGSNENSSDFFRDRAYATRYGLTHFTSRVRVEGELDRHVLQLALNGVGLMMQNNDDALNAGGEIRIDATLDHSFWTEWQQGLELSHAF